MTTDTLPNPGSPEASAMIDSMLAEYGYPANSKNAARAGYEAARRMLASAQPVAMPSKTIKDALDLGLTIADHEFSGEQRETLMAIFDEAITAISAQAAPKVPEAGELTLNQLADLFTGVSVSVDVSTGDSDIGNRLMGTVCEVMEAPGDFRGITLLVQDAEPNFAREAKAQAVPVGWRWVPVDPTDEMMVAWDEGGVSWEDGYRAMLSAAPQPPAPSEQRKPLTDDLLSLISEAGELITTARIAMHKLGLRDRGSDCRLPHEVRMFALDFSLEGREGPGALQILGTGKATAWCERAMKVAHGIRSTGGDHE